MSNELEIGSQGHSVGLLTTQDQGQLARSNDCEILDVDYWLSTQATMDRRTICWCIENHKDYSRSWIPSPLFQAGHQLKHIWQLKVYRSNIPGGHNYFGIFIKLIAFGDGYQQDTWRDIKLNLNVAILNSHGEKSTERSGETLIRKGKARGWYKVIPTREVDQTKLRLLVQLEIEMDLQQWKCQGPCQGQGDQVRSILPPKNPCQDVIDLGHTLGTSIAHVAISTPTKTFLVPKNHLTSKSSVFTELLQQRLGYWDSTVPEPPKQCLDLPMGTNDQAVGAMLNFIVTGDVNLTALKEHTFDLMELAEYYALPELGKKAEKILMDSISIDNAVEIFMTARQRGFRTLKPKIMKFILRYYTKIKHTSAYKLARIEYPKFGWLDSVSSK